MDISLNKVYLQKLHCQSKAYKASRTQKDTNKFVRLRNKLQQGYNTACGDKWKLHLKFYQRRIRKYSHVHVPPLYTSMDNNFSPTVH